MTADQSPLNKQASHGNLVLVVDDDVDARAAASDLLLDAGYLPITARNGLEALEILRSGVKPMVIVVDLHMPLMDGDTFCDACDGEPRFARIPRVIISVNAAARQRVLRRGAHSFVAKPIVPERLIEAILSASGGAATH